ARGRAPRTAQRHPRRKRWHPDPVRPRSRPPPGSTPAPPLLLRTPHGDTVACGFTVAQNGESVSPAGMFKAGMAIHEAPDAGLSSCRFVLPLSPCPATHFQTSISGVVPPPLKLLRTRMSPFL